MKIEFFDGEKNHALNKTLDNNELEKLKQIISALFETDDDENDEELRKSEALTELREMYLDFIAATAKFAMEYDMTAREAYNEIIKSDSILIGLIERAFTED